MSDNKSPISQEPFLAYEQAFDSENRRAKLLTMLFVLLFVGGVGFVFTKTIFHLGSLNAYVPGVFAGDDEKEGLSNEGASPEILEPEDSQNGQEYPNLDP
ncbi:MAG: hypothetical protein ACOH5I_13705 [Oligoflexus sp.]